MRQKYFTIQQFAAVLLVIVTSQHASAENEEAKIEPTREKSIDEIVTENANNTKTISDNVKALRERRSLYVAEIAKIDEVIGNDNNWALSYQIGKPGTRVYFDTGSDDEGEVDLFEDGTFNLNLNGIDFYVDRELSKTRLGLDLALGVSSANGEATDDSVVLVWSAGLSSYFSDATTPFAIEGGYLQGISANEKLDSSQMTDGALFVGVSFDIWDRHKLSSWSWW